MICYYIPCSLIWNYWRVFPAIDWRKTRQHDFSRTILNIEIPFFYPIFKKGKPDIHMSRISRAQIYSIVFHFNIRLFILVDDSLLKYTSLCLQKQNFPYNVWYIVTNAKKSFFSQNICVKLLIFWSVVYHYPPHQHCYYQSFCTFSCALHRLCQSKWKLTNVKGSYYYIIFHGTI